MKYKKHYLKHSSCGRCVTYSGTIGEDKIKIPSVSQPVKKTIPAKVVLYQKKLIPLSTFL